MSKDHSFGSKYVGVPANSIIIWSAEGQILLDEQA
jgi:hypothetical protein